MSMCSSNSKIIKGLSLALVLSTLAFLMVGNAMPVQAPSADEFEIETEMETEIKFIFETETCTESITEKREQGIQTEYDEIIAEIAERYSVSAALIKAVIETESGFTPLLVSSTEDYGLMQINICTKRY